MSLEKEKFDSNRPGMEFPAERVFRVIESGRKLLARWADYFSMPGPSDEQLDAQSRQQAGQQDQLDTEILAQFAEDTSRLWRHTP